MRLWVQGRLVEPGKQHFECSSADHEEKETGQDGAEGLQEGQGSEEEKPRT